MNILVIGLTDSSRSPMFAEKLRKSLKRRKGDYRVESVGALEKAHGQPVAQEWISLEGFAGVNLRGHTGRHVSAVNLEVFDLIFILDHKASRIFSRAYDVPRDKTITYNIQDPSGGERLAYEGCFHEINRLIFSAIREVLNRTEEARSQSVE
jgi:protein-tyrosine-phosphatase